MASALFLFQIQDPMVPNYLVKPMGSIQVRNKMETRKNVHSSLFSQKFWHYTLLPAGSGCFLTEQGFFSLLVSLVQNQRFSWQLFSLCLCLPWVWAPREVWAWKEPGCIHQAAAFQSSYHEAYWMGVWFLNLLTTFAYNAKYMMLFLPQYKTHFLFPRRKMRFFSSPGEVPIAHMNEYSSSHEVDVTAGHESKANISAPHICSFFLYFQIKPCVVNESACFAFLNWPGTKEAWGVMVSQDSGVVSLVWQNFHGNAYLDEEGWPRALWIRQEVTKCMWRCEGCSFQNGAQAL